MGLIFFLKEIAPFLFSHKPPSYQSTNALRPFYGRFYFPIFPEFILFFTRKSQKNHTKITVPTHLFSCPFSHFKQVQNSFFAPLTDEASASLNTHLLGAVYWSFSHIATMLIKCQNVSTVATCHSLTKTL